MEIMQRVAKVSDHIGDNSDLIISDNKIYIVQRRDRVSWRKWYTQRLRGEEIKVHDRVWDHKQWKKITRIPGREDISKVPQNWRR